MRTDFTTYKDFFKFIEGTKGYTAEYQVNRIHVFYNFFNSKKDRITSNSIREPLFTISMDRMSEIVTPYGFRLTESKGFDFFNDVEKQVILLSQTPIHLR